MRTPFAKDLRTNVEKSSFDVSDIGDRRASQDIGDGCQTESEELVDPDLASTLVQPLRDGVEVLVEEI
ncbi:hypothetical protein GCM10009746_24800 [Microbacterium paludicola]